MLKSGLVSDESNQLANDRLGDMVDYMQSAEYQKKRLPKEAPEEKPLVYIKGKDDHKMGGGEADLFNDDDDHELQAIRQRRMQALRQKAQKEKELKIQGHGMYREVTEKDFLPEVTSTQFVAAHFFHKDFTRCNIMHDKLGAISNRVVQLKIIKIDAQESPFFTDKLSITVLPCIILFKDGVAFDRIEGFEQLSQGDNFPTVRLEKRLCLAFKIPLCSDAMDEEGEDLANLMGC
eukprot:TRINITY_DN1278_c3_g1_i1.p1 TRINITY_DN1278_c3_g1~~TRINITY_DN1278_c3_g1_i1.p1  ORF type:complete len:255 (+),score=71.07 TRINITY_DN1278_c3_g1_i1:64-765(+)